MYGFSDGSPYVELLIFCSTFALCFVVVRLRPIASVLDRALDALARFLRWRIFVVDDVDIEQRRLDLIRIGFGGATLLRNAGNLSTALELGTPLVIAVTAAATLLSGLLTIGLMAPIAAALLGLLINLIFDNLSETSTLASMIMAMCCIALALAPVGRSLSVDARILKSTSRVGDVWRRFYASIGTLTLDRSAMAKLALMLIYGGISLSSGVYHLQASNWREGLTNAWVFINPVMTPDFHPAMDRLYAWSPAVYLTLVKFTVYGTLIFQLAFVPLLLVSSWTQRLAVLLELGFVAGSIMLLELHWLGWFQLAMCVILFWNRFALNPGKSDTVEVLYDDRCNLCDGLVRVLAVCDLFKIILFRPLSKNYALAEAHGISRAEGLTNLCGIDRHGRVHRGFALCYLLVRRMLLLMPLWPILWVARLTGIGPRIYAYVAARRTEMFGVCERSSIDSATLEQGDLPGGMATSGWPNLIRGFAVTLVIMLTAFAARLPAAPYLPFLENTAALSKRVFGMAPLAVGLMQVDAFNFPPLSGTLPMFELHWSGREGQQRFLFSVPVARADIFVSDMLFYQVQTTFNYMGFDGVCFSRGFSDALMNRLAVKAVLHRREFAGGQFHLKMKAYDVPSLEDFQAQRYKPLRYYDVCQASFPADGLQPLTYQYFQEGINAMAPRSPLPFPIAVSRIPLAVGYPCAAEAQRIGYWFDRPQLAGRDARALDPVRRLMTSSTTQTGLACMADALAAAKMVYTDWRDGHAPPSGGSCDQDLVAARAMIAAGLDAIVQDARGTLASAEAANARGDQSTCLLQAAALRRMYFGALQGSD